MFLSCIIDIDAYSSYCIVMTEYDVYIPISLISLVLCGVTFILLVFSLIIILWADLTQFCVYVCIFNILFIYKSVQMSVFSLITFSGRINVLLLTCSLNSATSGISNITNGVSLIFSSVEVFHHLYIWPLDQDAALESAHSMVQSEHLIFYLWYNYIWFYIRPSNICVKFYICNWVLRGHGPFICMLRSEP